MACISGIFQPTRKAENLVKHSGLICVDIDRQDNLQIDNWDEVKQELSKLPQIAYASLSVSGNGYFVTIPLVSIRLQHFATLSKTSSPEYW